MIRLACFLRFCSLLFSSFLILGRAPQKAPASERSASFHPKSNNKAPRIDKNSPTSPSPRHTQNEKETETLPASKTPPIPSQPSYHAQKISVPSSFQFYPPFLLFTPLSHPPVPFSLVHLSISICYISSPSTLSHPSLPCSFPYFLPFLPFLSHTLTHTYYRHLHAYPYPENL